jgi:archaellum biogenesis ATPase FlaH
LTKYQRKDGNIKFKEATQNMSNKEKIDYIWEYYKWWILASIAAVFLIVYAVNADRQTTHLHIAITSGFVHTSEQLQLDIVDEASSEFAPTSNNHYGFTVDTEELSATLEHLLLDTEQHDTHTVIIQHMLINFETIPVFTTLTGAGELDIIITYQHDFDAMASIGYFRNMRDLGVDLPDHLLYDDGILLKYLPILNDYIHPNNTDMDLILGVVAGSDRTKEVEKFLRTLFE